MCPTIVIIHITTTLVLVYTFHVIYPCPKIYDQDMKTWNRHRESKNTRNWFRYDTFIYLFEFQVFRHEERETQFLSILTPSRASHFVEPNWSRRGGTKNRLPSSWLESQLTVCFFFQIPKSSALPNMMSFTSPVSFLIWVFLLWHLWLSHPRARVNTTIQCVHLTNPCTNRKFLSPTKPKGKVYKTKMII